MKKLISIIALAVAIFALSTEYTYSTPGECTFDIDCGVGYDCVGPYGKRVCVKEGY